MNRYSLLVWLLLSSFSLGGENTHSSGLIWINGEPWTYELEKRANFLGASEQWDDMVKNAKSEFCDVFGCSRSDVSVIKIERREGSRDWFDVWLKASIAVGDATSVMSRPLTRMSAVIPVRSDGRLGVRKRVQVSKDESRDKGQSK